MVSSVPVVRLHKDVYNVLMYAVLQSSSSSLLDITSVSLCTLFNKVSVEKMSLLPPSLHLIMMVKVFNTEGIVLYERLTKVCPCDHNNRVPCWDTLVSILYLDQPVPAGCTVHCTVQCVLYSTRTGRDAAEGSTAL